MDTRLSVKECLQFGWNAFKTRPGILIGGPLLLFLCVYAAMLVGLFVLGLIGVAVGFSVAAAASNPLAGFLAGGGIAYLLAVIIQLLLSTIAVLGVLNFALKAHDNLASVRLGDLKRTQPFWTMLGVTLVTSIATTIGFAILIVPGIIAALFLIFAPYVVVDRGLGVIASLKGSIRLVSRNFVGVLLLMLALIAINMVGAILLLVGLIVTIPVTIMAAAHAYRTVSGTRGAPEVVAAPVM